jgi:hypothetical protein
VLRDGSAVSFRELFDLLETDSSFARWYAGELAARGRRAFFWEHPAITRASCDHPAEFVLVDGEPLEALRPDPGPFRSHFDSDSQPDDDVAVFPNLGGDALLLAPRPLAAAAAYPHLAVFLREAPPAQVRNLLGAVGRTVRENLSEQPRWLSTAGMGVPWVHVRIDSQPKYYRFEPYRRAPEGPR